MEILGIKPRQTEKLSNGSAQGEHMGTGGKQRSTFEKTKSTVWECRKLKISESQHDLKQELEITWELLQKLSITKI